MVYIIGIQLAIPAFTYEDIKQHDSYFRYIFVSPLVGILKSPAWPYFAINSDSQEKLSNKSVDSFFQALHGLSETNKLYGEFAISTNPRDEAAKIVYWLHATETILKSCDESELEAIYPGWGKSTALLKAGVTLAANASEKETPGVTARKDDLLNRYQIWISANSTNLDKILRKYSIEPLPKSFKEKEATLSNESVASKEGSLI